MDFLTLIATTTWAITDEGLDLINFFVQFFALSIAIIVGLFVFKITVDLFTK